MTERSLSLSILDIPALFLSGISVGLVVGGAAVLNAAGDDSLARVLAVSAVVTAAGAYFLGNIRR